MSSRLCILGWGLAGSLSILAASPSGSAGQAPISGTLDKPGYTVIALAANGQARSVVAPDGRFSLVPPAEAVTLHLRSPAGTYAGPVVLEETGNALKRARAEVRRAKRGVKKAKRRVKRARRKLRQATAEPARRNASKRLKKARKRLRKARRRLKRARRQLREARNQAALRPYRAILGVKAGAPLGAVQVDPAAGYALVRGLADKWADAGRAALANGDVPIGAGNFGHVPSGRADGAAIGDLDLDGIPNPLDIDDDGDLILDDLDPSTAARISQAAPEFELHSALPLPPEEVVNANAAALDTADIDRALSNWGYLSMTMTIQPGVELDCGGNPDPTDPAGWSGGLRYCTRGGSGRVFSDPPPRRAFPECCDADGDGFGTPPDTSFGGAPSGFVLAHGATTAEIGAADPLIKCLAGCREGGPEIPGQLNFVFATTPALKSYSDTAGNSGSVSYPVSAGDPGTNDNGYPVGAPSGQDIVLTLTSWRPQRERLPGDPAPGPGESATWTDIGGLLYEAIVQHIGPVVGGQGVARPCPPSSFASADLTLLGPTDPNYMSAAGRLLDPDRDRPASPAHTYTYSLNLTHCLASLGVTWNPNEDLSLSLRALTQNLGGEAVETVVFRREP